MAAPASSSAAASLMLAIHEKKTNSVEIYRPLRQFISINYSEREAQNLEDDLQSVKHMRSDLERPADSPDVRRDLLVKYFKALCVMESRFPISPDKEHINTIIFLWYDAFKNKNKASQQNIHFEKAAVLFNLGAVHSQIALSADRSTASGRIQASHSFMASAGAFAFLRDNASMKASIGQSTLDISAECAGMLERLMLAQAQECVFEKVIAEGKSPGLCAKISRQVGVYYEEAFAALNVAPLNQHFDRTWISHVQLKVAHFYAEACYRYGLELHEKEEIGEEIARLKSGISAIADAKKSTKGVAVQLIDAVNRLEADINRNIERAMKENDRVYLMRVPGANTLSPLSAASLVKSTPMTDVLDASKEKLFASLVPDSSAKALSRYTEMVDDIIRTQAEKLQQGSEIARVRLREMDLPESILALEGNFTLPMDLKEDVEAVQISGGPSGLEAELQQLKDLRRVNHELLVQTEEMLQKEAGEDAQFRSQFGTRWTRPQSSTLTKNLQDRLNRFAANLKQAAESDSRIERAVRDHSALMSILDRRPIESALPTLARPIMSLDANEDAIVGALKQSLRQLETLGAQRAGLEDMLKEMKRKDEILPKLMTSTGSYEDLFRKEIAKYDHICEEISQNIEAQEQLLMQIQAQNDEFAAVFNLEDYKASREKCFKQISAAIAKYREIKENINEGLKFYVTLQDAITNVKQQCSDFVMTRNIQCREMSEDVQRQMAGLNFRDRGASGYNSNYRPVGQPHQTQRTVPPLQPDPSRPQTPYYQQEERPPVAGYGQTHLPYSSPQQQLPPGPPPPYHVPAAGNPYPPQPQQQPVEYGQPAYPGWRGPYYNAQSQHPGSNPPPPYTIPPNYPPPSHQSGYYKHQ
ncbi:vacuolar-sorting protein BRO1-like [Macadamia integrifolia]|uniref:vacuolar-sorting protein BRO1-like n=1 Tax=Macadamia integrifolia TaxID=60698 RepID=UPI001C4F0E2C|nr:vacuolar-sorting protein BRO1-like [Macadamia integrifolia]